MENVDLHILCFLIFVEIQKGIITQIKTVKGGKGLNQRQGRLVEKIINFQSRGRRTTVGKKKKEIPTQ